MRKLMFGLLMCLVLVGMISFVSAECTDSDGGLNYYVKGEVGVLGEPFITKESVVNENVSDGLVVLSSINAILKVAGEETEIELGNSYPFYNETYFIGVSYYINKINFFSEENSENSIEIIATIFYEDHCKDSDYLIEHFCDENGNINYKEYNCPNSCEDGACISETNETQTCADSDGGIDYYVKGTTKGLLDGELNSRTDHCGGINSEFLSEFYCDGNKIANIHAYKCPNGCEDGACVESNESEFGMDACLDNPNNYWDQETDRCYSGYSEKMIKYSCSDPDYGKNIYVQAHTFGFRSYSSAEDPSRDLRIRTGGRDSCLPDGRMVEHYCDENGYIQTSYIECPNGCKEGEGRCIKGEPITEQIKCVFKNSKEEQQCYLAGQWGAADEGTKFCKGKEDCIIDFTGYKGEEITWKSTCGGYQYTKQDGNDETIEFDCKVGETNITEIQNKGFRFAYWQCYDGAEQKSEDKTSCKHSKVWQKYAREFCEERCYEDGSKCGVNSFSVWDECYLYEEGVPEEEVAVEAEEVEECKWELEKDWQECEATEEGYYFSSGKCNYYKGNGCGSLPFETLAECQSSCGEEYLICKNSCPLNDKCYPFGYRKEGKYCSDEGGFIGQLEADKLCDNNFECESNVCVADKCISAGFIQKIINWFRRLFGFG